MSSDADFGDAEFEPTDAQLEELAREAFADVGARRRAALVRLRAEIAAHRREARAMRVSDAPSERP